VPKSAISTTYLSQGPRALFYFLRLFVLIPALISFDTHCFLHLLGAYLGRENFADEQAQKRCGEKGRQIALESQDSARGHRRVKEEPAGTKRVLELVRHCGSDQSLWRR
jgi:hypothetical protein